MIADAEAGLSCSVRLSRSQILPMFSLSTNRRALLWINHVKTDGAARRRDAYPVSQTPWTYLGYVLRWAHRSMDYGVGGSFRGVHCSCLRSLLREL